MNVLDTHLKAYQKSYIYEFDNQIQMNWYPKRVVSEKQEGASLLELGLGHGITTNYYSNFFERHLVLDASPAVISYFKESFPNCKAEIQEVYFEDFETTEKFDLISMGFVLEHVDDPALVLAHYKQFLKPGGRIIATVPNAEVMNRKLGHIAGLLPDMQVLSEHDLVCGHKRYFTVQSFTDTIKREGYTIKRIEGIYLKPLTTAQMISLNLDEKIIEALCIMGIDYPELCCGILVEFTI